MGSFLVYPFVETPLENLGKAEIDAHESYEDEQEAVGWNNELGERAEWCKWNGDCKRDKAQGGEE